MIWIRDLFELIKIRILFAALLTTLLGYICFTDLSSWDIIQIVWLCVGVGFVFATGAAINHVMEVKTDSLMERTKNRPLPTKRVSKKIVTLLAIVCLIVGTLILYAKTNMLVLMSAMATIVLYDFVYTPLKKVTYLNTFVGALPGAMPIFCGWFMFFSELNVIILSVFSILYFWQLPHFYAIAWMNKDSYKNAKLKMISVDDKKGNITVVYLIMSSLVFIGVSYLPVALNMFHTVYTLGMTILHMVLVYTIYLFFRDRSDASAKKILLSTILYPQCMLAFVLIEKFM